MVSRNVSNTFITEMSLLFCISQKKSVSGNFLKLPRIKLRRELQKSENSCRMFLYIERYMLK
jgi:hypothetical protein